MLNASAASAGSNSGAPNTKNSSHTGVATSHTSFAVFLLLLNALMLLLRLRFGAAPALVHTLVILPKRPFFDWSPPPRENI